MNHIGQPPLNVNAVDATDDDVRRAMSGDRDALQLVIRQWYRRVYAHCQAKMISPLDAEDATQETFLRGFARINELRSPDAIGAWLRGIAANVCVDVIRRNQVRKTSSSSVEEVAETGGANPREGAEKQDQQNHLIGLIHQLPETLREAILLHYYQEMTYDEIAQWLGVARSTVNERLSKARSLLKRELLPETEVRR